MAGKNLYGFLTYICQKRTAESENAGIALAL